MLSVPAPHDLLWIADPRQLLWRQPMPAWVSAHWSPGLPLVVRRDVGGPAGIPVGIRGPLRSQRAPAWVPAEAITRVLSPEALVARFKHQTMGAVEALPVVGALRQLAAVRWPWPWGVTGSCGYMLATGLPVCRQQSDLDLVIRCPQPVKAQDFSELMAMLPALPCRLDIQLETPLGGCSLAEWLRGGQVMIKAADGPRRVADPWAGAEQSGLGR